jgi:hypothetical protein
MVKKPKKKTYPTHNGKKINNNNNRPTLVNTKESEHFCGCIAQHVLNEDYYRLVQKLKKMALAQ